MCCAAAFPLAGGAADAPGRGGRGGRVLPAWREPLNGASITSLIWGPRVLFATRLGLSFPLCKTGGSGSNGWAPPALTLKKAEAALVVRAPGACLAREEVTRRALLLTSGAAAPKEDGLPPTQSETGRSSGGKRSEGTLPRPPRGLKCKALGKVKSPHPQPRPEGPWAHPLAASDLCRALRDQDRPFPEPCRI